MSSRARAARGPRAARAPLAVLLRPPPRPVRPRRRVGARRRRAARWCPPARPTPSASSAARTPRRARSPSAGSGCRTGPPAPVYAPFMGGFFGAGIAARAADRARCSAARWSCPRRRRRRLRRRRLRRRRLRRRATSAAATSRRARSAAGARHLRTADGGDAAADDLESDPVDVRPGGRARRRSGSHASPSASTPDRRTSCARRWRRRRCARIAIVGPSAPRSCSP